MKNLRLILPSVLLAGLVSAGCFLISGQFQVVFLFDDPLTITSPVSLFGVDVNLASNSNYRDNKDKIKDVVDLAVLGKITNLTGTATDVEIWMVPNPTGPLATTEAAAKAQPGAVRIWGPLSVPGNATVQIDWNKSAALFTGRQALITEIKADGKFFLYAFGTGAYSFRINNGALVAVISAAN